MYYGILIELDRFTSYYSIYYLQKLFSFNLHVNLYIWSELLKPWKRWR